MDDVGITCWTRKGPGGVLVGTGGSRDTQLHTGAPGSSGSTVPDGMVCNISGFGVGKLGFPGTAGPLWACCKGSSLTQADSDGWSVHTPEKKGARRPSCRKGLI